MDTDKQLIVSKCIRVTDASLVSVIAACPLLIEIDLSHIPLVTDASVHAIFLHLGQLRELKLAGNASITGEGIPNLAELHALARGDPEYTPSPATAAVATASASEAGSRAYTGWFTSYPELRSAPSTRSFDFLRVVDLSGCTSLTDAAVDHLTLNARKIRSLNLGKCSALTNASLVSIGRLSFYLHQLHLSHISK